MRLLNLIFGCACKNLTFPLTVRRPERRTYRVCLTCGKEFTYSWQAMRVVEEVKKARKLAQVIEIGEFKRRAQG